MKVIECEQYSQEWWDARLGIPTASAFSQIITSKGTPSKQADGYLNQLVAERITGMVEETFTSLKMEEGKAREATARRIYAMDHETPVQEVGFCLHDSGLFGCSPDGLVGDDGMIEIKNPMAKTTIGCLRAGDIPADYFHQVQGGLLVTERAWCDFVVYYPGLWRFVVRVLPDLHFHKLLYDALNAFSRDLDIVEMELRAKYGATEFVPVPDPIDQATRVDKAEEEESCASL